MKKREVNRFGSSSPTDARLDRLAQAALGPSGHLVYLHEIHSGWWQARCESNRAESAIIVQACSRAAVARGMTDLLRAKLQRAVQAE